jgi:hypothetical protein
MPEGLAGERELQRELIEAHEQMLARDTVFQHCEREVRIRDEQLAALSDERDHLDDAVKTLQTRVAELENVIERMRETRVWKLGEWYWGRRMWLARVLAFRRSGER